MAHVSTHPYEQSSTQGDHFAGAATALKAIKRRCLDCSGSVRDEVKACSQAGCDLHPFRFGRNPNRQMSPEQKVAAAERLAQSLGRIHSLPESPGSRDD